MKPSSLAALIALLAIGLTAPASAAPAPRTIKKAIWGPVRVNGASQFPRYRDLGVGIYEIGLSWAQAAPTRPANATDPNDPAYIWDPVYDDAINQARRYGIQVSIELAAPPTWATGGPDRGTDWAPQRPADVAAFATAAARRYPSVRHWMVLGEPSNVLFHFRPFPAKANGKHLSPVEQQGPRHYARILDAVYGALKAANPSNLVIGGNTFTGGQPGSISTYWWLRNMRLPNGGIPRMDLYGHNPFGFREPDLRKPLSCCGAVDFSDLENLSRWVNKYLRRRGTPPLKLFLSEWTVPTDHADNEFYFYVSRATQARWIRSAFRVVRSWPGIYTLGWIHFYDSPPERSGRETHGGLLDYRGRRKPGYYAYKAG
jgi:hypothetical protein